MPKCSNDEFNPSLPSWTSPPESVLLLIATIYYRIFLMRVKHIKPPTASLLFELCLAALNQARLSGLLRQLSEAVMERKCLPICLFLFP